MYKFHCNFLIAVTFVHLFESYPALVQSLRWKEQMLLTLKLHRTDVWTGSETDRLWTYAHHSFLCVLLQGIELVAWSEYMHYVSADYNPEPLPLCGGFSSFVKMSHV